MQVSIPPRSQSANVVSILRHGTDHDSSGRRRGAFPRRGSCLGRIEQVQSPAMDKALDALASDLLPRKPRRSMSPSRSVSPDFEEDMSCYGYEDADRTSPRSTRDLASTEENTPRRGRRGSAVSRLQLSNDQIGESDEADYGYEDMGANRKLNETTHPITSDLSHGPKHAHAHANAKSQRHRSALGSLEADSEQSSSNRAGVQESDETDYGYGDADYGYGDADYGYGDADMPERSNKATPSVPAVNPKPARPKDVKVCKARRRGSAFGRLEVISETVSTDKLQGISQSKARRRGSTSRTRSVSPDFEQKTSDGSRDTDQEAKVPKEKAARRALRLRALQLAQYQVGESHKSDYGYEDVDANRTLDQTTHSPTSDLRPHAKSQRRGSALGRLEADSKQSSSNRAGIQESDKTDYGYGDADYGYGDADMPERSNKATPSVPAVNPKPARPKDVKSCKARRRGSAFGRLEVISETSTDRVVADKTPSQPPSRRRMSMEDSPNDLDVTKHSRTRVIDNAAPSEPPSRRRVSTGAGASVKEVQKDFQNDAHVVARSRRSDTKDRPSSGVIPQRPPGRANRRGSACGRLQGGEDLPCSETLDRIQELAQGKMGRGSSKMHVASIHSHSGQSRSGADNSIPWWQQGFI
jgi:hypothetical protein